MAAKEVGRYGGPHPYRVACGLVALIASGLLAGCETSRQAQRVAGDGMRTVGRGAVRAGQTVAQGARRAGRATVAAVDSVTDRPGGVLDLGAEPGGGERSSGDLFGRGAVAEAVGPARSEWADDEPGGRTTVRIGDGQGNNADEDEGTAVASRRRARPPRTEPAPDDDDEASEAGPRAGDVVLVSADVESPRELIDEGDGIRHDLPELDLDAILAQDGRRSNPSRTAAAESVSAPNRRASTRR